MKLPLRLCLFIGVLHLGDKALCGNTTLMEIITIATGNLPSVYVFDTEDNSMAVTQNISTSLHTLYDSKSFVNFIENDLRTTLDNGFSEYLHSYLNIVIFCKVQCIQDILLRAADLDVQLYHGVFLRHFSTWLLISNGDPITYNITMDNVAWIKLTQQPRNPSISALIGNYLHNQTNHDYLIESLQTLVWLPGRREWRGVPLDQMGRSAVFPNTMKGFNGRILKASALEWLPFTMRYVSKNTVHYEGASIDIFNLIADKYNFSYAIIEPKEKNWGQAAENITLDGILGQIHRAEVDFCIVPYGISSERMKFVDITYPILADEYGAIYRQRKDETHEWLALVTCFQWPVYLCGTAAWLLVLGLSYLLRKIASFSDQKHENVKLNILETGVSIPLRQDAGIITAGRKVSSRILIFFWSIFCFLITTVYIGNLVAVATVMKVESPFDSLEDLAQQTEYAVGTINGSYADDLLRLSKDPTLKKMFEKVLESKGQVDVLGRLDTGTQVQRVIEDKSVLITSRSFRDVIRTKTCDTSEMKQTFFPFYSGFLFPLKSPLRELFERELLSLVDHGIMDKIIRKWTPKPKLCYEDREQPLFKLEHIKTVGLVCSALVLAAVIVLVIELIHARHD